MSIEKDISSRVHVGQTTLQQGDEEPRVIDEYYLQLDLPDSAKKRETCVEHLSQGAAAELMSNFILGGTVFPEADEPQEITTQISCKGVSCILKKCGLLVEQFDSTGKTITQMKLEQ